MIRRSKPFQRLVLLVAFMLLLGLTTSCREKPRSLVLVTISGWRQGAVGGKATEPPSLAGMSLERAEGALTPAPEAVLALAGLMTGRRPSELECRFGDLCRLPAGATTLAERFQAAGFGTAAFVGQPEVGTLTGLARGFETWVGPSARVSQGITREEVGRLEQARGSFSPAPRLVARAGEWIKAQGERPVFVWIHLADIPQAVAQDPDPENGYLAGWGEISKALGTLPAILSAGGSRDRWVASIVSLHGLNLGEQGELLAGLQLTQSVLAVPVRVEGGQALPCPPGPFGLEAWGTYLAARAGLAGAPNPESNRLVLSATFQPGRFFGWPNQGQACDPQGCLVQAGEAAWLSAPRGAEIRGPQAFGAAPAELKQAVLNLLPGSDQNPALPGDAEALRGLREARAALGRGDAAAAWENLRRSMDRAPAGLAPRTAAAGFLQSLAEQPEYARFRSQLSGIAAEAMKLAGDDIPRRLDLAGLLQSLGRVDEARALLSSLPKAKLNLGEQLVLVQRLVDANGLDEAVQILEPLANADPAAELQELLGDLYNRQGNGFRARQALEKALSLPRGRTPNLLAKIGDTLAALGEKDAALQRFAEAVALDPEYRYPHSRAADIFLETGRAGQAADAVVKSIPPTGDEVIDGLAQAHALARRRLPGAAVQVLTALSPKHPDDLRIELMLARILIDGGDRKRAQGLIDKVLAKDSGQPLALVESARIDTLEQRFGPAREALKRAAARAGASLTQRVRTDELFLKSTDSALAREAATFQGRGQGGQPEEGTRK